MRKLSNALLLTGMLTASFTSFAQNSCFTSLSDYSFTGVSTVRCTVKGDFNGDGHLDEIFPIYTTSAFNQIGIVLGNGSGGFTAPVNDTVCQRIQDIKAYDFNGDGKLDIVAVSNNQAKISICLGNGTGTFKTPVDYSTGTTNGPNSVDLADFNEDGKMDLVVSNQSGVGVSAPGFVYFRGNGDGTFNTGVNNVVGLGSGCRDITAGDFDEDGHMDVVVTNGSLSTVSYCRGLGTGLFAAKVDFPITTNPQFIKKIDVNNDTHYDLVVSNTANNTICVMMGDGAGSFAATDNYAVSGGPMELVVDDFNEDGNQDVAVISNADNTVGLFLGTGVDVVGSRFPLPVVKFPVVGTPHCLMNGDYDEDGHVDLIVPAQASVSRFLFLSGTGTGSFNTGANITTDAGPNGIASGEFNGDSNSDLVTVNKTAGTITFLSGNGDGTYAAGLSFPMGGTSPVAIVTKDLDGDGFLDLITANSGSGDVSVLLGNGAGSFSAATVFSSGGTGPSDLVCADFNGDSNLDLAVSHDGGTNDIGIMLGDGAGNFGAPTMFALPAGATLPKGIIAGLFDNTDLFLDIAVANATTNNITVFYGDGTGSFAGATNFATSTTPVALDSKDMNGDGRADIAVACNGSARVSVLKASGTSSFTLVGNYMSGALPQGIVIADFNNDGKNDVATSNKVAASVSGTVSVFMGIGTGALGSKVDFTVSNNTIGIVADYIDGGTLIDLAVVNFDANNVSILLNTTAIVTVTGATTFCAGGSVTLTASTGATYLWSPTSAVTPSILATTTGNYHVTISNPSGLCSSQSTDVAVTVNPLPTITSITGSTTICSSASTTLTANGSTGTLDIDWYDMAVGGTLLSPTATYTTPVLTSTTTYYVTAVEPSTGCVIATRYPVTVNVGDVTPPVITGMPSDMTLNAGATCTAVATWTAPNATDECALSSFTGSHTSGSTFPLGTTTVTYTATDAAAHVTTASFTVTVNDVTNPVISGMPSNITTNVAAGTCAKTVSWTAPTASDNCSVASLTPSSASGSSFPVGTTIVTYTATDGSGNIATASFTVTVVDNILPTISGMPSNQSLNATTGTCGAVATWTSPTASDNCAISTFTSTNVSGSTFPVGVTTVTYTATDVNGNVNTSSFTITVNDTQLPTISSMPSDITTNAAAGTCAAAVTWTAPTASDNCSISSFTPSTTSGSSFPVGTTTVTYTAIDVNGNSQTASFDVTVVDDQNPTFPTFPSNISIPATAGACDAVVTWTTPTTADNCGVASVSSTFTSGSTFNVGPATTVTYTVTDVNGNVTDQSFTVTVYDAEAPVISGCPTTQTVCEGTTVSWTDPTATDNCSGVTIAQLAGLPSGSVFPLGTTLCTFRATDGAGNITNCNFNIIVNANPVATLTLNPPTPTICVDDFAFTITGGSPLGGVYSGTGVTGSNFSPVAAGAGTHTITYVFTNGSGCSDTATDDFVVDLCLTTGDLATSNFVKLYPNPTSGMFTLEIINNNGEESDVTIFSNLGELVYAGKIGTTASTLDLTALSNGVYMVKIQSSSLSATKQLIIQK